MVVSTSQPQEVVVSPKKDLPHLKIAETDALDEVSDKLITIKSPMIGTFYQTIP